MTQTSRSQDWYYDALNRAQQKSAYPNLTLKELKKRSKESLQLLYNKYTELSDNLYWQKEKYYEYKHFKELPAIEKQRERIYKNIAKIEKVYNSK